MYGGHSGCYGFIFYNKTKDSCDGVYGYYEGDEIRLECGTLEELKAFKREQEKDDKSRDNGFWKRIGLLVLSMAAANIAAFNIFSMRVFFAVLIFCIVSFLPMVVILAIRDMYVPREKQEQFRRFHGCEHACLKFNGRRKRLGDDPEKLKDMPIYDSECGTAYAGYMVFLALVLAVLIVNPLGIGFFKAAGILVLTVILLFINIFNPYNPFKMLQRPVVAQPTEREYRLGWVVLQKMWELEAGEKTQTQTQE